mmetsp:Transcript_10097/g.17037  ORF Transcript_10097/g.17037 Transcript_10097/m.17037 type:complete len:199 (+) Transcript_10097:1641-2237(+)
MASAMPTTRNDLRDCCRAQFGSIVTKYQDEIVKLIAAKIEKSHLKQQQLKQRQHTVFENVDVPVNPEFLKQQPLSFTKVEAPVLQFEGGSLPSFTIRAVVKGSKGKNQLFGRQEPEYKTQFERIEKRFKERESLYFSGHLDLLQKLTGFSNFAEAPAEPSHSKPMPPASLIGKRVAKESEGDEDDIVVKVVTEEVKET